MELTGSRMCERAVLATFVLALAGCACAASRPAGLAVASWREHRSRHFIVRYVGDRAFAERTAREAETHYKRIARQLGYTRHGDFWLWDKRVVIRLYPTPDAFRVGSGAPVWAAGRADYRRREVSSFDGSGAFLGTVLPHELTHLIFRDFVGFEGEVPLWLDEGVAQCIAQAGAGQAAHRAAARYLRAGRLLPVASLTRADIRREGDARRVGAFYVQAASLVGFMLEQYGQERFRRFCTQLRDGKRLEEALRFTYPRTIRTIDALNKGWTLHLEASE